MYICIGYNRTGDIKHIFIYMKCIHEKNTLQIRTVLLSVKNDLYITGTYYYTYFFVVKYSMRHVCFLTGFYHYILQNTINQVNAYYDNTLY